MFLQSFCKTVFKHLSFIGFISKEFYYTIDMLIRHWDETSIHDKSKTDNDQYH